MKLKHLYPNDILSSPEQGIQELMRGFLVRTNFVPGVRHVIGWRGLKESFTSVEGWTAKIKGFSGVFGMYFDACDPFGSWLKAKFGLLYFPDPQEELVEHCSLQAGAYTQEKDYLLHIRDFLRYPQLCELFHNRFVAIIQNEIGEIGLDGKLKDLLNEFQLRKINRKLKEMNPTAPILLTRHGDINPALVYGVDPQDESVEVHRNEVQKKTHHQHPSHEFDRLSSYKISLADPLERGHFIEAIQSAPRSLFRIKGVVDFTDDDKPWLFQYVGGRFEFSEFNNPKIPNRFLILIGQNIRKGTELIDWSRFFCSPQHLVKLSV